MRLMLGPKSARAKQLSNSGKSHGMRNRPGSLSFSRSFFKTTAEQFSFKGVLVNSINLSLLFSNFLNIGANLGGWMSSVLGSSVSFVASGSFSTTGDGIGGGWMSSVLGSSVSFVASGSFSTTGDGIGGGVTKAFISFKYFSKRLIRISNLSSREAAICWSSKELEGEEDGRGAFVLTLESVVFEGGKNWFMILKQGLPMLGSSEEVPYRDKSGLRLQVKKEKAKA
nr:hypothetical protein [Tanacetum cinerariifolium]